MKAVSHCNLLFPIFLGSLLLCSCAGTTRPEAQEDYAIGNVAIGAGGNICAIVIHPSEPDLMYIRTDIGGPYRWDPQGETWIPLFEWVPYDVNGLFKVNAIALAPSNPDIVYVYCGYRWERTKSDVLKSTDRGRTWSFTDFPHGIYFGGERTGERIAIHPEDENVVYVGTVENGLFRSQDAGGLWEPVTAGIPGDENIKCLLFDGPSTLYAGGKAGLYRSTNGGATFELIPETPAPDRMSVASNHDVIITHGGGIARLLAETEEVADITPGNLGRARYMAADVSPDDPQKLFTIPKQSSTGEMDQPVLRSSDGGKTWETAPREIHWETAPAWYGDNRFASATDCAAFDPHHPGQVFFVDWYLPWRCPDIWAGTTQWYAETSGIEEKVFVMISAPPEPSPELYSIALDGGGLRHVSLHEYPEQKLTERNNSTAIDYCEMRPEFVAMIDGFGGGGSACRDPRFKVSEDYAATWEPRHLPPLPAGYERLVARLACSATDPNRIVYLPHGDLPYVTRDGGHTWDKCRIATDESSILTGHNQNSNTKQPLASDRVNGNVFYLFHDEEGGVLYRSSDGGESFAPAPASYILPQGDSFRQVHGELELKAARGHEGHLILTLGKNGAWISADGGDTFERADPFEVAVACAWGKEAPESDVPTAYVYGRTSEGWGVYRSLDMGANWLRLNGDDQLMGCGVRAMAADPDVFGRFYVATNGRGVYYGEPVR